MAAKSYRRLLKLIAPAINCELSLLFFPCCCHLAQYPFRIGGRLLLLRIVHGINRVVTGQGRQGKVREITGGQGSHGNREDSQNRHGKFVVRGLFLTQ